MWDQIGRLHVHHGDVPAEIRILKLTEEVGKAAEALIGMRGLKRSRARASRGPPPAAPRRRHRPRRAIGTITGKAEDGAGMPLSDPAFLAVTFADKLRGAHPGGPPGRADRGRPGVARAICAPS